MLSSIITQRLILDRPTTSPLDTFSFKQVLKSITSPHVVLLFIALFMDGTLLYGLALFLPSIVNQLGFGKTRTQLISVGPFACGFVGRYLTYCIRHKKSLIVYRCSNPGVRVYIRSIQTEDIDGHYRLCDRGCGIYYVLMFVHLLSISNTD